MSEVNVLERRNILRERYEPTAPSRDALQEKIDSLLDARGKKTESDRPEKMGVPDIVLRDKESWDDIGWSKNDRKDVSDKLRNLLELGEDSNDTEKDKKKKKDIIENLLQILVADGVRPEDIKNKLGAEAFAFAREQAKRELDIKGPEDEERKMYNLDKYQKFFYLKSLGITRDDYIQHFILKDEFKAEVKVEFNNEMPQNLSELARDIAHSKEDEFGVNGTFPVIQIQIKKNANGTTEGRYCVNEANFMRWIRSEINVWYDIEPEAVTDYFSRIKVQKGPMTSVDLGTMLYDPRLFKDETGIEYEALKNQVLLEPWMLMTIRQYDVEYKNAMGDEGKLAEMMNKEFFFSKLTKKTFDKTMMYYMATLSTDFQGKNSDSKMGEAWNKIFLAYYNIADFDELERVLGKDSSFFTRDGMMNALLTVYAKKEKQTGMPLLGKYLGDKAQDFAAAFDTNGKIKDKKAFIKFINFFTAINPDHDVTDIVRQALRDAIQGQMISKQGKEGLVEDTHTLQVAELIAFSWLRFSGAGAKNDIPGVAAFDAQTKWLNTEAYRRKMATKARGGAFGNPYTVPMFKAIGVDMMRAVQVSSGETYDENGKARMKTPLEVMMEMRDISARYEEERKRKQDLLNQASSDDERVRIQQELDDLDNLEKVDFKISAGELEFKQNALQNYAANHVARAKVIYEQIMGAHEIDFDKFTKYDSFTRGVSFNRAEFQKQVQEGFLKPLRYLYETFGNLDFNMDVRAPVFKGREDDKDIWEYESMKLGKMIFGYEILNIPEFRKKNKAGKAIKENGRYVIDYAKVQKDQTKAWKQWALMKFGADLWAHIDRHGRDPAYGIAHYFDVLEALESIPGEVWGTDDKMKDVRVVEQFFSHHQMKWLKKMSGTTNLQLYTRGFIHDLFSDKHRKDGVFNESFGLIIGAIFRGY